MAEVEKTDRSKEDLNLIVALRIRPLMEHEIITGATPIAHKVDNSMVVLMDPTEDPDDILRANRSREKQYVFDYAFDGPATQDEVYEHTAKVLIPSVTSGFNATVFAYGATGAGKTHTMLGHDKDDPGIMARALNDLFLEMDRTREDMSYKVTMSYLEIYNEMIRDLLNPSSGYLELREDSRGVCTVAGLTEVSARSTEEVMQMLMEGNKERTQEPTAANKTSSRSHAILQVKVRQRNRVRDVMQEQRIGKLFLVDLAGSERAANTHNRGKRMVEGAHINRSLLALGNVINSLSDKNGTKYVNFRDSKLTRLLKDSLGGNCKTVMIAHISPASFHFEESRNTLTYADRAKNIKTKVRKNVMDVSYHIVQYTNIITELRDEIKRLRVKLDNQQSYAGNKPSIHAVQSEVMSVARREDQTELNKLKDQLINLFKDQMELRRSLMELNNTAMEISLEATRNQLLVKKWERERELAISRRREDSDEDDEARMKEHEKALELGEPESIPEPDEVRVAKDELMALAKEKERTERLKSSFEKELENAKDRAACLEESLPQKVTTSEQNEILSLMCKVHELEIENMEMQSSCLLRNFEIRRKHMVITQLMQHRNLCDEIIQQQRSLLEEHNVLYPKDLEELYVLYQQEFQDRPSTADTTLPSIRAPTSKFQMGSTLSFGKRFLESDSISDVDRLSTVDEEHNRLRLPSGTGTVASAAAKRNALRRTQLNMAKYDDDKVFAKSPKADELREAAARTEGANASTETLPGPARQRSIITLSSQSNPTSPTPPVDNKLLPPHPNIRLTNSFEELEVITSNTRSIAALAAQRRSKAHLNALNNNERSDGGGHYRNNSDENKLTVSRLAYHDNRYGGSQSFRNGLDDTASNYTDQDGFSTQRSNQNRIKYRKNPASKKLPPMQFGGSNNRQRSRLHEPTKQTSKSSQRFSESQPPSLNRAKQRQPRASKWNKPSQSTAIEVQYENDLREFETTPTPPVTVRQKGADRGNGLTIKKKVRGPAIDGGSTTLKQGGMKKSKRPPPTTIPNYKNGDISITGHGFVGGGR